MISLCIIGLLVLGAVLWVAIYVRNEKYGTADFGKVTLQVSGALDGTYSGQARFDIFDVRSAKVWVLNMRDEWSKKFNFQLSLSLLCGDDLAQPIPGHYTIAPGSYGNTRGFSASFSHIVNSDQLHMDEYNTLRKGGGVLIMETVDDREVRGNFMFNAHGYDNPSTNLEVIEVTGEFTARKAV